LPARRVSTSASSRSLASCRGQRRLTQLQELLELADRHLALDQMTQNKGRWRLAIVLRKSLARRALAAIAFRTVIGIPRSICRPKVESIGRSPRPLEGSWTPATARSPRHDSDSFDRDHEVAGQVQT
jgi:hypothetical protein